MRMRLIASNKNIMAKKSKIREKGGFGRFHGFSLRSTVIIEMSSQ